MDLHSEHAHDTTFDAFVCLVQDMVTGDSGGLILLGIFALCICAVFVPLIRGRCFFQ